MIIIRSDHLWMQWSLVTIGNDSVHQTLIYWPCFDLRRSCHCKWSLYLLEVITGDDSWLSIWSTPTVLITFSMRSDHLRRLVMMQIIRYYSTDHSVHKKWSLCPQDATVLITLSIRSDCFIHKMLLCWSFSHLQKATFWKYWWAGGQGLRGSAANLFLSICLMRKPLCWPISCL